MIDASSFNATTLEVVKLSLHVVLGLVALSADTRTTSSGCRGGGGGGSGAGNGGDDGDDVIIDEEVEMKFCMLNERLSKYEVLKLPIDAPRQKISK